MRSHRIQFLPIEWRSTFATIMERAHRLEAAAAGVTPAKKKNRYTLAGACVAYGHAVGLMLGCVDITLKDNVAFARELFNNVIMDLPLFMRCVRQQSNREDG